MWPASPGSESVIAGVILIAYFLLVFLVSTLPASDLIVLLVRPSFNALAAARAVAFDDSFLVCDWASALPASDLAVLLTPASGSTFEAILVTLAPEDSCFAMMDLTQSRGRYPP
ncbi:MAG: hypothetical protein ABS41_11835 [Arenimonas sp. SCN 70-307]|nr:MAG: hypothetical protein ABS41_11835 [Arenimonas sp. SCN 70-307]